MRCQAGALNGEGKHFEIKASNISGNQWCAHLVFGSEDGKHKDVAEAEHDHIWELAALTVLHPCFHLPGSTEL